MIMGLFLGLLLVAGGAVAIGYGVHAVIIGITFLVVALGLKKG